MNTPAPSEKLFVPTGCTMLNLYLSNRVDGGWLGGTINHVVGDSDTGKTLLLLTTMAAVAHDPNFNRWKLLHDDVETACEFDIPGMFGKLAGRLEAPYDDGSSSELLDTFYFNLIQILQGKFPVVYGLDSMDFLDTKTDRAKFDKQQDAYEEESTEKQKGSYGMSKAKINSDNLKRIKHDLLPANGGILLIISQTRDAINTTFPHKTHAGGNSIKFASNSQLWMAVEGPIKRTIGGVERQVGTRVMFKITKNHTTGLHGRLSVPMYYGHGLDDLQCCVDWMVLEKFWTLKAGVVGDDKARMGKKSFTVESLRKLDEDGMKKFLQVIQESWDEVERSVKRPGRWSLEAEPESPEVFE